MKKLFALVLTLCMLCGCAAMAENDINWEDVAPLLEESGVTGDFYTFDDVDVEIFVPAGMISEELPDDSYIGYFTDRHIYPVIIELAEKLKNLIVTHQYRYRDNKFERLSYLIARFQEPSFQSVYLKAELPHLLFEDSGCSGTVRNLLYGLSEKREWNSWDDVSVEMLYVLFYLCLSHAESPCDRDFYNEVGRSQVTKGIEILKYYMQQSVDAPFAVENAVAESTEYERILRSGDLTNIKNMIIGNKKTF